MGTWPPEGCDSAHIGSSSYHRTRRRLWTAPLGLAQLRSKLLSSPAAPVAAPVRLSEHTHAAAAENPGSAALSSLVVHEALLAGVTGVGVLMRGGATTRRPQRRRGPLRRPRAATASATPRLQPGRPGGTPRTQPSTRGTLAGSQPGTPPRANGSAPDRRDASTDHPRSPRAAPTTRRAHGRPRGSRGGAACPLPVRARASSGSPRRSSPSETASFAARRSDRLRPSRCWARAPGAQLG